MNWFEYKNEIFSDGKNAFEFLSDGSLNLKCE